MNIVYGPVARATDWWCAGQDAKVDVESLLGRSAGPPRMALLQHDGMCRVEQEWLRYKEDVTDQLYQLASARARQAAAVSALAVAERQLRDGAQPTEEQLTRRVGGEERTTVGVIRDRRLAEHRRASEGNAGTVRELREELAEATGLVARLADQVQARFELAQAHASAVYAYVFHRRLVYLSRLIRRHPDGKRIGQFVRADVVERPQWTVAARSPDLRELGG